MVSNWLITGGCGFIGTSLIHRLLADTPETNIRVLDNLSVGGRDDLASVCSFREMSPQGAPSGVELCVGDIRDAQFAQDCARGADCIVHLAANTGVPVSIEHPRKDMESNIIGVFNMLEAARACQVRRFVFASSSASVGNVEPPIHEKMPANPASPYGASKLAGEGYCLAYYASFGISSASLRFGNVYGPRSGHKSSVVAKFIRQALVGEPCEIYGDGGQTRDFIYIDDLIDAVLAAAEADIGAEIFQIATNRETTVREMAELLASELAKAGVSMDLRFSEPRHGDVLKSYSDTSKAERLLGWKGRTTLDQGMGKTIAYFLDLRGRQ